MTDFNDYGEDRDGAALLRDFERDHRAAMDPCMSCCVRACREEDRKWLIESLMEVFDRSEPPWSPVQNARRSDRGHESMSRHADRDPGFVARMDQAMAEGMEGSRRAFEQRPRLVRAYHRARFALWVRVVPRWWGVKQRHGVPPYERVPEQEPDRRVI